MVIRIVRMYFTEETEDEFLDIFNRTKDAIASIEGCLYLELFQDVEIPYTYTTISHWTEKSNLDNYRHSELFKNVWGRVKTLFSQRAEAFSLEKYMNS